jgi:hypothetical protein
MSLRPLVGSVVTLLLLTSSARSQMISDVPAPVTNAPKTAIAVEHVEAPAEIALGTMAVNVWARVSHPGSREPITSVELVMKGDGREQTIAMKPLDGAFDSTLEDVVGNVDTYTWVRDAAHEYEIRATTAGGTSDVAARGVIRVRARVTTPDLVVFDASGLAHAWIGSGAGGFAPGAVLEAGVCIGAPWVGDVDGNGIDDVLCPTERGRVEVFRGRAAGKLELDAGIDVGGAVVVAIAIGDVDGNDKPDIVSVTSDRMLEIRQDMSDVATHSAMMTLLPETLALADLNGDGLDEIYVGVLGLSEGEIQAWSKVGDDWMPQKRLAAPAGSRGRIHKLVRARTNAGDRLLVLSAPTPGEGILESWGSAADTESDWDPTPRGRFAVSGEPLDVLSGRFRKREDDSWIAVVSDGRNAKLFGIREGEPARLLGEVDRAPSAFAVMDLDGDGDDDLVTGGEDLRLWINVQGEAFREAGESPYLLEQPVTALAGGSLDERRP